MIDIEKVQAALDRAAHKAVHGTAEERAGRFSSVSDRWFFRQRQQWIAEMLHIYGFINRDHLKKKFEISTPQASYDLRDFQINNPGVVVYNTSAKRYEVVG